MGICFLVLNDILSNEPDKLCPFAKILYVSMAEMESAGKQPAPRGESCIAGFFV